MELPIEKINRMGFTLLKVAALLLVLSCLFSCRSSQQISKKHLDKALAKDRGFVIDTLRKIAPCVIIKQDTVTLPGELILGKTDTIPRELIEVLVPCPDSAGIKIVRKITYSENNFLRVDTAVKRMFITTRIRDMADSIHYSIIIIKQDREIKKQKGKVTFWMAWSILATLLLFFTWFGNRVLSSIPRA